jgi:hypothetical protein
MHATWNGVQPSFCLLRHSLLLLARHGLLGCLSLEGRAPVAGAASIEGTLESIAFPTEDVVTMLAKPGCITHRIDEGLSTLGPDVLVVELARVPHDFVHQLREPDGVAGGAGAGRLEATAARVCDVALVVGAVDVLAIPASTSNMSV